MEPTQLYWRHGETDAKDVLLKIQGKAVQISSVEAASPEFKAELFDVKKSELSILRVTPSEINATVRTTVRVNVRYGEGKIRSYYVYLIATAKE